MDETRGWVVKNRDHDDLDFVVQAVEVLLSF